MQQLRRGLSFGNEAILIHRKAAEGGVGVQQKGQTFLPELLENCCFITTATEDVRLPALE